MHLGVAQAPGGAGCALITVSGRAEAPLPALVMHSLRAVRMQVVSEARGSKVDTGPQVRMITTDFKRRFHCKRGSSVLVSLSTRLSLSV